MNEFKVITFPLKFVSEYRDVIKAAAEKKGMSMNKFILEAIEEKIQRQKEQ
jgi:uncharacterized protein (DUF1778 family)